MHSPGKLAQNAGLLFFFSFLLLPKMGKICAGRIDYCIAARVIALA